ncbi:MATH and LRR domain-containing protein PFE0570w [Pieris rapae]|uniref:MATH and LRR domain-containing protein PFE0570w n=1 Tax=Pieris rapae TaxID=64459 RepID=UPI001E27FE55|nr:MATH and LRR domain-containing protein PFE0570w [Pieris rapae]
MDAKDLRSDSTLVSAINDGNTNFDESNITLLSNRNKPYQDIESNSLGKVEAQGSRPCAIIGPDRVQPPPTAGDTYLKKASVEPWPCSDTVYQLQAEIPPKLPDYQSMRNISPRQTFQENMQRIMVPPYHSSKSIEDNVLKNSKVEMPLDVKYCDVPYSINPIVNSQKSIRTSDAPITAANSPYLTVQRHGWSGAVGPRPQRPFAPEFYQYPEVANFSGQQPLQRLHRPPQEDPVQGHPDRLYNEASVRFKPYPSTRERYTQHRYDYVSNYPNTYHQQLPFPPQKYDISKTLPSHPYPMYPQVPIRRVPDPIIDPYQRPSQPNFNPYQNQYISHSYGPVQGNCIPTKMYPYPPDMSPNTLTPKLPYDVNSKLYVDYENVRNKMYSSVDNMTYFNDPKRQTLALHPSMNMHHIPQHHVYRKDIMPMKPMESPHPNSYPLRHHLHYSPSLAKSSAESFSRLEAMHASIGGIQEDCGYVSQSSSASGRSIDSGNFKNQNDIYRKSDTLYGNGLRTSQKQRANSATNLDKKGLDVRQFLQMWNEGDDEVSDSAITSTKAVPTQSDSNPEQLVILGSMTIPNEELSKYEHIQKISKLPENIKGYNSIELLDQYEQLVETPAARYNKKPMSHEYQLSSKIARQSPLIPRPLSPLDVEAKISQSVIHKEVGCNFEIKPCSPKMMNVEIATPLHNIISERAIDKVLNTGVLNSQVIPNRTDIVAVNSPTTSCKMSTSFISNDNSIKNNNYSLQDLESNSGVCLASLPRLDSDIELNFPEINQQFIDANRFKISTTNEDLKSITAQSLYKSENDIDREFNDRRAQTPELNFVESAKLSKYRKIKTVDSFQNETRTDSVIIKNPDTLRRKDVNNDAGVFQEKLEHIQRFDMKSDMQDNTILKDMSCSAIDFSLNTLNQNSEDSTHSDNIIVQATLKTDAMSTKEENETQMCPLSLVTKKVEVELSELEQNDYNTTTENKQSEPGFSLGLIYEDTAILPELDPNPQIDHPTHIVTTMLDGNKSLSDIESFIPCSPNAGIEDEIQFECDKANRKDEDIFKDDIVIAALNREHVRVKRDNITKSNKNNMDKQNEIVSIQNSKKNCSIKTNKTPEPQLTNDLTADSNIHEESANQSSDNRVETHNIMNKRIQVMDNAHPKNTENLDRAEQSSVEKTLNYENVNNESESAQCALQLNNSNAESELCECSSENDICKQRTKCSDKIISELSIIDNNLNVVQVSKLYVKEDTNTNNEYDSNVMESDKGEISDMGNSWSDSIAQMETGVNHTFYNPSEEKKNDQEVEDVLQENLIKNNIICTSSLQFTSESLKSNNQNDLFSKIENSSQISANILTNDGVASSNHNNENSLNSCNNGLNELAPDEMLINENALNIEISSCLNNDLPNNEVSEDVIKHHVQNHTISTYKKSFYKRCFTKEYFSPWMQKLYIFSSGLCVKSSQKQTEDIKDEKYLTNTDNRSIIGKNNYECVDEIERNINDTISTSIPNNPSQDIIEKTVNPSQILIDERTNHVVPDCIQKENIGTVDRENIESNNRNYDINETPIEKLKNNVIFQKRVDLKRSLSDSAIDLYSDDSFNKVTSNKRRRLIIQNFIESRANEQDVCDVIQNNRRKSISTVCNNNNLLILINDNEYIIAEEDCESSNMEYVESSEFLQVTETANNVYDVHKQLQNDSILDSTELNVECPLTLNDFNQEKWLGGDEENVEYVDNIFNDDVAVDITISAPISPENSNLSSNDSVCTDNESDHIVRIKEIYGENMCINDMQIVETLYKMPQMNVNKTLVDIESQNTLENKNDALLSPNEYSEILNQNISPISLDRSFKNDDDIILEHGEDRDIESSIKINDDNDVLNEYNGDEKSFESCELINNTSLASNDCKYSASSSPEVSSTTSEDKCSSILLKITSVNGSRLSEINNVSDNVQQLRYKFTEKNDYNTNYRPLITKAAQKYIPPIIEPRDLKVKLPLPQNSLNKLKELKLAKSERLFSTIANHKKAAMRPDVRKKVKPKFEDVLKSIDEIQFKMHKDKLKKTKHSIPKVLIKKHENGAHYASTSIKKKLYNPDLTGRKWQPWVFIERNEFIDKMAQRNKRKAVYCHRKKTFVLEEKLKKYKSICTAKFVISQPTSDHPSSGNLKYTIRLKHNY